MLRVLAITACSTAAVALAACGSDAPDYCQQREELGTQIAQIRDTNVVKEGTDTLRTRVDGALAQTQKLADSAKSDFPDETRSVDVAVTSLRGTLAALENPDRRAAALANIPGQLQTTVDVAEQLQTAVQKKCS